MAQLDRCVPRFLPLIHIYFRTKSLTSAFDDITQVYRLAKNIANGFRPSLPREWPNELAELVSECWHQSPHDRPSAAELVRRLEDLRPVITRTETLGLVGAAPAVSNWSQSTGDGAACACCSIS